jgi:hypothetical protein
VPAVRPASTAEEAGEDKRLVVQLPFVFVGILLPSPREAWPRPSVPLAFFVFFVVLL